MGDCCDMYEHRPDGEPEPNPGYLLGCNCLHSGWTKSLVCKGAFITGIRLFRSVSENLHCVQIRRIDSLSAVRTTVPTRPDARLSTVPSVRTTCHTVQTPDRPSIIRPDDVYFGPDPSLYREASVPACFHPDDSAACPDALQYSTKLPILSKIIYGKIAATVRTKWISVRTLFSSRQESQFKFNRLDVCQHGPDVHSTDMEITDSTSTVQTPAFHVSDARSVNMEIAC